MMITHTLSKKLFGFNLAIFVQFKTLGSFVQNTETALITRGSNLSGLRKQPSSELQNRSKYLNDFF